MVRYFTRLRMRRIYKWGGRPYIFDRKLKSYGFDVEGQEAVTTVTPGQYILIEGNDDEYPFVAKLLKFFGDESHKQKKALVQWFLRLSEVPQNKKLLLGRSPHPQEIFYYLGRACDNEINAESILGTVDVQHVPEDTPFPEPGTKDTLYVKLSWDTKAFNVLDPVLMQDTPASTPPKPALPLAGSVSDTRATMSAGKRSTLEAESIHSASKLSASKILSAKRRGSAADTPGVRKKLQLSIGSMLSICISRNVFFIFFFRILPLLQSIFWNAGLKYYLLKCIICFYRNLLDNTQELISDGDDDCFVPSKKDLQSSSDEEKTDSEEETRGRNCKTSVRTPCKTPSKKVTPSTPRHATPSIPSRTVPARQPGNILEEARARLHVSSVPESLPCREQEFQDIYNFVESKVMDGTGGCMYISGVPGTGKTATIHEVIRCLQHASDMDEIPTFRFIEINGMKMTDPHQAYVQILQKLTDQKVTADHAAALLEKRFSNPAPKKETTVLLVDELDLLWTRKQNVMYNLFDWPTRRHARLVVLTIANTMDLPERIMINRVASRLGLTRMSFQPYSFKQLQQIITSRLNKVKAFEEDALQLVSRKVAALSGDARRCLDICRRATEICEHSTSHPSSAGLVRMNHVMEALDEMFSSSYITAIRCASLQEQLFLRAVIAEFRRLGLEEATFQQVFVQHRALSRVEGLQPISVSEGLAVCQRLGACRLLLLEASRLDMLQRVRLNVSQDDVLYALKAVRD
uniref:Origin recognition complex subunit 1 n=1 Tax=Oncorhynchus tshawytscha TaxID=74940 RepID=A0AAZ3SWS6_ONCTS